MMGVRRALVRACALAAAALGLACGGGADAGTGAGQAGAATEQSPEAAMFDGRLAFRSTVAKLYNHTNPLAEGMGREDTVEVVLPGRLLPHPVPIPEVTREAVDRTSLEGALASDVGAFRADDADWILENFAPGDRDRIQESLGRADLRERNRAALAHIHSMEIWGMAQYQDYGLVMYRYDGDTTGGLVSTFVKVGEEWKRTNVLGADHTFDVVLSAWRRGVVRVESSVISLGTNDRRPATDD